MEVHLWHFVISWQTWKAEVITGMLFPLGQKEGKLLKFGLLWYIKANWKLRNLGIIEKPWYKYWYFLNPPQRILVAESKWKSWFAFCLITSIAINYSETCFLECMHLYFIVTSKLSLVTYFNNVSIVIFLKAYWDYFSDASCFRKARKSASIFYSLLPIWKLFPWIHLKWHYNHIYLV